jgi:large subunit ribosomal protein L3
MSEESSEQKAEAAMAIGVVGKKSGMTRIFTEEGESIAVTVIEVVPNRVTQVKQPDAEGYHAIQVTAGTRRATRVNKPMAGHFAKAGTGAGHGLWEFRLDGRFAGRMAGEAERTFSAGDELGVEQFEAGQMVDVAGVSKGKGFAGTIKRWNFAGQDRSHGNSLSHRVPGSIGQNQTPGRVFKGKKMAGQMGNRRVTTQNLQVVRVDTERGLLLIRGAVPGPAGGDVYIRPAVKA